MRLIIISAITGFLLMATCSDAAAFGRGGGGAAPPRGGGGGAPPHVGGGGGHGVGSGPFGGVHEVAPPHVGGIPSVGGARGVAPGPFGGEVVRPGGGVRPGGEIVGGARGAIGDPRGTAVGPGGYRGGVDLGRGIGGASPLGNSTAYVRPSTLRGIGVGIRGGRYPYFTNDWFGNHRGAWFPAVWAGGLGFWGVPLWDNFAPWEGIAGAPIPYDYGSTAVIQDDSVYLNGEPLGTVADYSAQALALDDEGRGAMVADTDEWEPLGVFGLIQGNEAMAQRIFQLAVNKNGIVRGNYYDAVADSNQPVFGQLDKKSQRLVWSVGDRKDIVYEAGLNNLLQNETTVLIHYGKERTQQMIFVRLPPPQLPPPQQQQQPQQPPPQPQK